VIGDTWTTEESLIYAADYLALQQGVCLYAEACGPSDALNAAFPANNVMTLALGGQGRRVSATRLAKPVDWPAPPRHGSRRLLVLTSPGIFSEGWKPRRLDPVAAAVPRYEAFSGWDLARGGPKATRFAAAAGSVFYFDSPPPPSGASLCDDAEDGRTGWGRYLEGIW
jgi:CRISPR-associated protein Cmr3